MNKKNLNAREIEAIRDSIYNQIDCNKTTIGILLKKAREAKGYTQELLHEILSYEFDENGDEVLSRDKKLSVNSICSIELGNDFTVSNLAKLCLALDVDIYRVLKEALNPCILE